ncbi:MAG: ABC transporter ATP-binding protein/permease [Bacilli bacterium]|nr:ABC transporter ATP-binding protein/permease [Bacilli bacterium]
MKNVFKYLKHYWWAAVLAPVFMIAEVGMDMVLSLYMEKMVDFGISTGNIENVYKYGLIMLGVLVVGVACGVLSGVFANVAGFGFSTEMRKDVFKNVMAISVDQTEKFQTGSLVTRTTNDITQIQNMVSMAIRGLVRALSFFVLGIVFSLSISLKLAYVILVMLAVEIVAIVIFVRVMFPIFPKLQVFLDKLNGVVHENVTGARVVKAFGKEEYENNRFDNVNGGLYKLSLKAGKLGALMMPLLMVIIYAVMITIYFIGGNSIFDAFNKWLTSGSGSTGDFLMVGEITQAITYVTFITMAVAMLTMQFLMIGRASASLKRVNEVLNTVPDVVDGNYDISNKTSKGEIIFNHVSFKYPENDKYILSDLSFTIPQGETVAIVGSTGSGKSSLVNLLCRFYDVNEGEVLVDGVNVKDYKQEDLRNIVSICLQKSELFAGTMASNIKMGKLDAKDEEVMHAADLAQASEFISSKEGGLDARVEEKGTSLSGGQKQRLSIARAIIKNPEILIFDDSTSALDLITEAKLHKGLREEKSDVTKIIVAQRIATAKNADRIMVLDGGSIVGFDTHDNLMASCGVYKDIYDSQLKREEGSING